MKKRLLLFECFFLVLTIITIKKTYGLFETESKASSNIPIAKWVIKVDGKDLSLDKELNYTDFTIDSNGHSDAGYFAPGSVASYTLGIDTSASEVAISYEITIDASSLEDHPNIKFQIIDLDGDSTSSDGLNYKGIIKLEELSKERFEQYLKLQSLNLAEAAVAVDVTIRWLASSQEEMFLRVDFLLDLKESFYC